jgi:inorganic triphosphatase YgiF
LAVTREIELKLELEPADVDRFAKASVLANVAVRTEAQTSTYFDTPDQALRKAGLSLRIRAIGNQRIQTIKAESGSAVGLFNRPEWEMAIEDDRPVVAAADDPFRSLISADELQRLEQIFRIVVCRQTHVVESNGTKIELVLDQGAIAAGSQVVTLCDVELELKQGLPAAVFALARRLDAVTPLQLSAISKAQRGYRLLDGLADRPVRRTPLRLTRDMVPTEGFEAIAYACIRQFRLNQSILAHKESPEALHQARVALRRLRSAMSIFEEMLVDDLFEHLVSELRWIARELDMARNLDVLLERSSDATVFLQLQLARRHAYSTAAVALGSPRLRTLMLDLVEWITIGNWRGRQPDGTVVRRLDSFAAEALERCRRRVKRRGRHWGRLDSEARHRLRIGAKKLRYAADFFGTLFPGAQALRRHKAFLKVLHALQNQLGELNDQRTGAALLAKLGLPDTPVRTIAESSAEAHKILLDATVKTYRALVNAKRFWK